MNPPEEMPMVATASDMKNDTSGDEISVRVDESVDMAEDADGAEMNKEVGPAEGQRTKEEFLMAKQDWFDHGGEGGIAKSAMAAHFFLVAKADNFGCVAPTRSFCQQSLER
jgi:hypothetical protein